MSLIRKIGKMTLMLFFSLAVLKTHHVFASNIPRFVFTEISLGSVQYHDDAIKVMLHGNYFSSNHVPVGQL